MLLFTGLVKALKKHGLDEIETETRDRSVPGELLLTVAPSSLPGLRPEAHIYVLAMVLIFSIPLNFGFKSN